MEEHIPLTLSDSLIQCFFQQHFSISSFFAFLVFPTWYPCVFEIDPLKTNCLYQALIFSEKTDWDARPSVETIDTPQNPKTPDGVGSAVAGISSE